MVDIDRPATGGRRWAPAVVVAAVLAAYAAGLPLVELATSDPATPATEAPWRDRLTTASAGGVSVEPAADWSDAGSTGDVHMLRHGAATFEVEVREAVDCAAAEVAAVDVVRAGEAAVPEAGRPYVAGSAVGTLRSWWGPLTQGLVFTSCDQDRAVTVVARAPAGALADGRADEVSAMLSSLQLR